MDNAIDILRAALATAARRADELSAQHSSVTQAARDLERALMLATAEVEQLGGAIATLVAAARKQEPEPEPSTGEPEPEPSPEEPEPEDGELEEVEP